VQVLGDFTVWEPVSMQARGGLWTVDLDVPAGTHHFGFLVDGAWYLPDDAPDAVPDEWGRRSATMVVEGEGGS
jgi:1,4-alpha-glucan branching enzyme